MCPGTVRATCICQPCKLQAESPSQHLGAHGPENRTPPWNSFLSKMVLLAEAAEPGPDRASLFGSPSIHDRKNLVLFRVLQGEWGSGSL